MARYSYEIGLALDDMTNVEELDAGLMASGRCVPPSALAVQPWSIFRIAADGREYGDGFPTCRWVFNAIHQDQLDDLLAYLGGEQSASLYIRTRKIDRSYAYYSAVMHRPKENEITPAYSDMWHDVTFRFTMLEEIEE
jgi:hypothetical protein